jgi:Flp pilus assembly pilin Flp
MGWFDAGGQASEDAVTGARRQRGQAVAEYALILALVSGAAIGALAGFGERLGVQLKTNAEIITDAFDGSVAR